MSEDVRVTLAREIVAEMSDEDFMNFTKTEQRRRDGASTQSLMYNQRVRFPQNMERNKRLRGATGRIVDVAYKNGKWQYKVKMDHATGNGETFIRVARTMIEVIGDDVSVKFAGPRQSQRRTSNW